METEKASYSFTPRQTPYRYCTFKDLLEERVQLYEHEEALIYYSKDGSRASLKYKDLNQKAKHIGRYLITTGISKGDRIAMYGSNSLNMAIAEFGVIMAGAVPVYLSLKSADAADAIDIMKITECKCLLLDPGDGDKLLQPANNIIAFMQYTKQDTESTVNLLLLRENSYFKSYQDMDSVLQISFEHVELPVLYPEDLVILFTTSGTTGKPKILKHTHFSLMNLSFGLPATEPGFTLRTFYNDRPFGWIGGSAISCMALAEKRVFTDTAIAMREDSAKFIWNIVQAEKCTYLLHVPYFLVDLLANETEIEHTFRIKTMITGGQLVKSEHLKVVGVYCEQLNICYGSTEGSISTLIKFTEENINTKMGDLGFPLPGTEIKIVDEMGNVTKVNQTGEICVRSTVISTGYFNTEEKSKKSFMQGGWVRSGDVGYISSDGHVFIQGRLTDVISRGTRKIMPSSVEEVIMQMEGLGIVVVVPVPDERLYQEICACFVVKENYDIGEEDVETFSKKTFTTETAVDGRGEMPKYFLKFDKLPVLASGKTDLAKLKLEAKLRVVGKQR